MQTTNELREQLAADVVAPPPNIDRTSQVRGRIAGVRKRRTLAAGAAALTVVAVAALVVLPQLDPTTTAATPGTPSPSPTFDVPLADYYGGGHLLAQGQHTGSDAFTIPFTAANKNVIFRVDCFVPGGGDDASTMVTFEINGAPLGAMSCNENPQFLGGSSFSHDPTGIEEVRPGEPGTLRVFFESPVPAQSRVRVGIYEKVPLASYQFPPAPDPLPVLEASDNLAPAQHRHPLVLLSAGPTPSYFGAPEVVGAQGTWTKTFTLHRGLRIDGATVAPGRLTIEVDGRAVDDYSSWDYTNGSWGNSKTLEELGISAGDEVTITVVAERFPGDSWALLLSDEYP